MIAFDFAKECYRCTACGSVCPVNAISFSKDLLPNVNKTVCVDCGKCERVCIRMHEKPYSSEFSSAHGYVCRNNDTDIRKQSSSGGVFCALAEYAIKQGWLVAGVIYDADFMPCHILTDRLEDVHKMLGSKYVTSDMGNIINQIGENQKSGRKILFSGTPCQVAAITNLFQADDGIISVTVACHGSIDREIWKAYLEEETRINGTIVSVTMRDKSNGWLNYGLKFSFADGTEHITYRKQDGYFLKCFTSGLFERDRCLACNYKGSNITADILLADAWGMDELYPALSDEWGLSSVLCLTERGQRLFEAVGPCLQFEKVDYKKIVERNQRIISPAPENPERKRFMIDVMDHHAMIQEICQKYAHPNMIKRIKCKLARFIKF